MALATVTGRRWTALTASVPGFAPIPEEHALLVGARDLDPAGVAALAAARVAQVTPATIRSLGAERALAAPLAVLAARVERLYLHIDLDVLDRDEARVNEFAAAGGLTADELRQVIARAAGAAHLGALAVSAYDPECDPDVRARDLAIDLLSWALC